MARAIDADALKKELAPYEENDFSQQIDVILKIVEAQPTLPPPNEWVSVEERLPDDKERVIAYRPKEADVSAYKYCVMWGWSVKISMKHRGISHWMPLPEPPEYRPPEGEA